MFLPGKGSEVQDRCIIAGLKGLKIQNDVGVVTCGAAPKLTVVKVGKTLRDWLTTDPRI